MQYTIYTYTVCTKENITGLGHRHFQRPSDKRNATPLITWQTYSARTNNHSGQFTVQSPIHTKCVFLDCGRKPSTQEENMQTSKWKAPETNAQMWHTSLYFISPLEIHCIIIIIIIIGTVIIIICSSSSSISEIKIYTIYIYKNMSLRKEDKRSLRKGMKIKVCSYPFLPSSTLLLSLWPVLTWQGSSLCDGLTASAWRSCGSSYAQRIELELVVQKKLP